MEKSTFQVLMQRRSSVGALAKSLPITQIDRILTCAKKGTISKAQPSHSEVMNQFFSNLLSVYRKSPLPVLESFSLRQRTLSISIAPRRSLAFQTPKQSLHPQLGPCTCSILTIKSIQGASLLLSEYKEHNQSKRTWLFAWFPINGSCKRTATERRRSGSFWRHLRMKVLSSTETYPGKSTYSSTIL